MLIGSIQSKRYLGKKPKVKIQPSLDPITENKCASRIPFHVSLNRTLDKRVTPFVSLNDGFSIRQSGNIFNHLHASHRGQPNSCAENRQSNYIQEFTLI